MCPNGRFLPFRSLLSLASSFSCSSSYLTRSWRARSPRQCVDSRSEGDAVDAGLRDLGRPRHVFCRLLTCGGGKGGCFGIRAEGGRLILVISPRLPQPDIVHDSF